MPKKPPFNHFRKSCCSPSNNNKKKKKLQVPSVPCKKCACLYYRWVCGEGQQGEQKGRFWWPCQPLHRPGTCWTCLPQKTISWGQAPACGIGTPACGTGMPACSKGCVQGDSPHAQPCLQGEQEPLSPHTRGTHCLGTKGALGLILYPASHRRASFLTTLHTMFPRVPVDSAAARSH